MALLFTRAIVTLVCIQVYLGPINAAIKDPRGQRPPGNQLQRPPSNLLQRPPGNQFQRPPGNQFQRPLGRQVQRPSVNQLQQHHTPSKCSAETILIYQDCKICACPVPGKAPKCYKKTCDLRTKDSGQCPQTFLRADDSSKCRWTPDSLNYAGTCKTDVDCPGNLLCCFDFCKGSQCVPPIPWTESKIHPGRGYA